MATPATDSDTFEIGGDRTVHRLGLGAMRVTGPEIIGQPEDEDTARSVLDTAVDLGVDLIDTADSYGPGVSERLLGETVADREDVVVASKAGLLRNRSGDWLPHGDPDFLHNQVLCSLDRLGVETIDLYQFHRPDPDTPFEDSVHAFAEMKDAGQIDHVGLSNVSVDQLDRARDIVEIATVQNRYNVADRESEAVLEACERYDIGFFSWGPLYAVDEAADTIEAVADDVEATPYQVALAWLLDHSPVVLPIPGTASVEHLRSNLEAASLSLPSDAVDRLDRIDPPA